MKTENMIVGVIERKHLLALLAEGNRIDGRQKLEVRDFTVEAGLLNKAEGSAKVQMGNTIVYAGVKASLGSPFPDTPNQGVLIVNIELSPLASPYFESGPPRPDAIELSRVCDRGLRESHVINVDDLCEVPGEKVWIVFVDIYPVADDGNLLDASSLAAMAALATTKLPVVTVDPETKVVTTNADETKPLPINRFSSSVTFSKVGDDFVVDPVLAEEKIEDVRFTVGITTDEAGNPIISALQKSLSGSFTRDEIHKMLDIATPLGVERIAKLREKLGLS